MKSPAIGIGLIVGLIALACQANDDWLRFRGPNGSGVSETKAELPVEWSDQKNVKWKLQLNGPGGSSPIVVGDKVFVTYYSGYGLSAENPGDQNDLQLHLVCVNRNDGSVIWDEAVKAKLPEEEYGGMFAEHGYATHTPVSDGANVYVFYGKSGVHAYNLEGKKLWSADVGSDLDGRRWGTASSPVVFDNLLIVPAFVESKSLVALDKTTGNEVWRETASGFTSCWSSPVVVQNGDGKPELIVAVPMEIWAFDPATGDRLWQCDGPNSDSMCSSVVVEDGVAYALETGPRGGGAMAVRIGGSSDVSDSHTVWSGGDRNRIGTPIIHGGYVYWVSNKVANCINAADGSPVYQERLAGGGEAPPAGGGGGRRGRRGGGGQDYSSPVAGDGKVYYPTRNGTVYVYALGPEFKLLATNTLTDSGQCISTPAISDGEIFLHTYNALYCLAESK